MRLMPFSKRAPRTTIAAASAAGSSNRSYTPFFQGMLRRTAAQLDASFIVKVAVFNHPQDSQFESRASRSNVFWHSFTCGVGLWIVADIHANHAGAKIRSL
jgi:hypothetical protein